MGCWAIGSFDNDDAADWVAELIEQNNLDFVRDTIAQVLTADGYVDAPIAARALAAVETLAALLGRATPAAGAAVALTAWIARVGPTADAKLVADAVAAVDRIAGAESELRELWEETDDFVGWQNDVAALRKQLQP